MKVPREGAKGTRYRRSVSEKVAIVRESMQPGITATHVARKHKVALNVLYYWRKVYRDLVDADLSKVTPQVVDSDRNSAIADLELQVRNLERLLGRRTLEIALLRERLGMGDDDAANDS
jgi:transposase